MKEKAMINICDNMVGFIHYFLTTNDNSKNKYKKLYATLIKMKQEKIRWELMQELKKLHLVKKELEDLQSFARSKH